MKSNSHRFGNVTNNFLDVQNYHTRLNCKEKLGRCLENRSCQNHYHPCLHDPVACDIDDEDCVCHHDHEHEEEHKVDDIKVEIVEEEIEVEVKEVIEEYQIPFVEVEEEIKMEEIYEEEKPTFEMDRSIIEPVKEEPKGMVRISLFKRSSTLKW